MQNRYFIHITERDNMLIDRARELIASQMNSGEVMEYWFEALEESDPAHYGLDDVGTAAEMQSIFVEIHEGTFAYASVTLFIKARMVGSNDKNGVDANFSVTVSGRGTFEFVGRENLKITSIQIDGRVGLPGE
jgi:hypothetical protein